MPSAESEQILALLQRVFRRRKRLILACTVAILAPIAALNELVPPTYEATTAMVFDEFIGPVALSSHDDSREIRVANRLEELNSYSFAQDIADALPAEAIHRFRWPEDPPEDFDAERYVPAQIHENMVAYAVRKSNIVRISVEMHDPWLCMTIANTAARVFQERNYKVKQKGVSGVRRFIEEQLERSQEKLGLAEEALKQYKQQNRITSFDGETREFLRRTTEAEVLYNAAMANRRSLEERLAAIEVKLAEQRQDLVPSVTAVANPWAQRLKQKLVELQLQYMELKVQSYPPTHPKMVQLEQDIEQTKRNLIGEAEKIAGGQNVVDPIAQIEKYMSESVALQIEIESLRAQEAALRRVIDQYDVALADLPEKEFHLARLMRERDVNRKVYMMLLEKLEESRISEAEKIPSLRIFDAAQLPEEPIKPRTKLNLAVGLLLGLLGGTGLGLVQETVKAPMESTREIERLTGWPVLATIPRIDRLPRGELQHANGSNRTQRGHQRIRRGLVSFLQPDSGPAEAYRMLRTNLQFQGLGDRYRTMLVTSIGPSDGKSTTIANLAISTASVGYRTLLVDAEVRRPGMHLLFGVDREPGLSDVLGSRNGPNGDALQMQDQNSGKESNIQTTWIENLQLLASGAVVRDASNTISQKAAQLRAALEDLKQDYDVILIDSPPLLLVHDTTLLASLADGVLFIVNSNRFDAELLEKAKRNLENAGADVAGAVLNHVEPTGVYKRNPYYHATG